MGLDIQKIGQNFAASFTGEGFNMMIGNKAQDAIGAAGNMLPGLFGAATPGGVKKCNVNQGQNSAMGNQGFQFPGNSQSSDAAQQQNPMQQIFNFTLNLVKMVLDIVKGGANKETPAAKANAETAPAAAATAGTPGTGIASAATPAAATTAAAGSAATANTEKAGTAAKTDDMAALLSKFKEMIGQLEKQMSGLNSSLEKAAKGGKKASKSSKKGFQSLIDKGLKFGTDILKFSKMFGI